MRLSVPYDTQNGSITVGPRGRELIVLCLSAELQRHAPVARQTPAGAEIQAAVIHFISIDRSSLRHRVFAANPARADVGAQTFGELAIEADRQFIATREHASSGRRLRATAARRQSPALALMF